MEDGVPPVQVSAPGGESSEVTLEKAGPGLWRSTVDVKVPGPLQAADASADRHAACRRQRRHRGRPRDERGDGDRREAQAPGRGYRRRHVLDARRRLARRASAPRASTCRASPCWPTPACWPAPNWLGLKDREAFVTRGVKLIPMFTGFLALAALLALLALTWWREGR